MGEFDLWSVIYREWEPCCAGSLHPPLPMPRWAASLPFVIPPVPACRGTEAGDNLPRYIRCARKWNRRSLGFAPTARRGRRDDKGEGGDFYEEPSNGMDRKKQQLPPLRAGWMALRLLRSGVVCH
jgi:hypothetical protein